MSAYLNALKEEASREMLFNEVVRLYDENLMLASKLALAAEDDMGYQEAIGIMRSIVRAEDDFRKSTGMSTNDALASAIQMARQWVANA